MNLKYEKKNIYENLTEKEKIDMERYINGYMNFMAVVKTEYEGIREAVIMLENEGFKDIYTYTKLKSGDKVYFINKEKSLYAAVIGSHDIIDGLNIIGAHIDSPSIDLKPMPIY